ncbi:MAG: hypothetical protein NLN64_06440 [Candidatus Thalassarchaeaceae archaeon]|nr:hypothetical protein [Candidatus Thalassarchaeaceae archaeon]
MGKLNSIENCSTKFLIPIFFIIIFIPSPAQALCIGPESCGILGGVFLSMLTVPICVIALILAIWPVTRRILQIFAILPGLMIIVTGYLMVIQGERFDLIFIPLIHMGIMFLMIYLGRLGS